MKIASIFFIFSVIFSINPRLTLAQFNVNIRNEVIGASGSASHISTDQELTAFGISLETWRSTLKRFRVKEKPRAAFYRDPTPYGYLFAKNRKNPTKTNLKFVNARIIEQNSELGLASSIECHNSRANESMPCEIDFTKSVTNSITSSWNANFAGNELTHNIGFDLELKLPFANDPSKKISSEITTNYKLAKSFEFGRYGRHEEKVNLGTAPKLTINAAPNQTLVANLTAIKSTMRIEIEYEASLEGETVINFKPKSKGLLGVIIDLFAYKIDKMKKLWDSFVIDDNNDEDYEEYDEDDEEDEEVGENRFVPTWVAIGPHKTEKIIQYININHFFKGKISVSDKDTNHVIISI